MSIDLNQLGAHKVSTLSANTHLLHYQTYDGNGALIKSWKIYVQKPGGNDELYTLPDGNALDEVKASACAKVMLAHLEGGALAAKHPVMTIGDRQISSDELKPKETRKLKKAGLQFPITVECNKFCSQETIRNAIRNFDMSIFTDSTDPIDKANRKSVIQEIAESEPHLIYAFVFFILVNHDFDEKVREMCSGLFTQLPYVRSPAMWSLMDACRKAQYEGKKAFVTRDNVIHLAMLFSGFDVQVIEFLKSKGFSVDSRWNHLLPKELAAILGASDGVLKALGAKDEEMVDLACHNVSVPGSRIAVHELFNICCDRPLGYEPGFITFKAGQLQNELSHAKRSSADLFKRVMLSEHDILDKRPHLIATICSSTILSSSEKLEMIKYLLERSSTKDLRTWFNYSHPKNPLLGAIHSGGDEDLIRFLIESGASIEIEGFSLVHEAACFTNVGALKVLHEMGVNFNGKNAGGNTPFDLFILSLPAQELRSHTYESYLQQMLMQGLDFFIQKKCSYHSTPALVQSVLHFILETYSDDLLVKFIENYSIPLSILTQHSHHWLYSKALAKLIPIAKARGEDLSQLTVIREEVAMPLLPFAIREHIPELVRALLDAGVSCVEQFQGRSPRLQAMHCVGISRGSDGGKAEEIVTMVEEHLAGQLGDERTEFHRAAARGDTAACQEWIAKGGYLPMDINGLTPLHDAVIHGHLHLCKILYKALEKEQIRYPSIEMKLISQKHVRNDTAGGNVLSFRNRSYTRGGSLLAHALVNGNEAMIDWAWKNDLQNAIDPASRSKMRYKGDRERELVFDALYHIACHHNLQAVQRACERLYRDETVKECVQEEPLIVAAARQDLAMAAWVCKINNSVGQKAGREAIHLAVDQRDIPMLKFLISQGALGDQRSSEALSTICHSDDAEMFLIFSEGIRYDLTAVLAPYMPNILMSPDHNILKAMIARSGSLSPESTQKIIDRMKTLFGQIRNMSPSLLFYLIQHARSEADWDKHLDLVKKIFDSYPQQLKELISPENFLKQVFEEILEKFQKKLAREEGIVERLFALLLKVTTKSQVALYFNALQKGCPFDELSVALEMARVREIGGVPPVELFKSLPKDQKIQWLTYFAVSGFRGGFDHSWYVINDESDPEILFHALKSLEMLGVSIPLKKVKSRLAIFFDNSNENVRIQALKTMTSVLPNPKCEYCKAILMDQLKRENSKPAVLNLLQLTGYYENTSKSVIEMVIELSHSADQDIRVQAAFTLSRMYDDKALKRAAEIVKSHDWDFMDEFFGDDRKFFPGAWWMFIYRPEFHDSRSGMLRRINDSFAFIHRDRITAEVNKRMEAYEKNPAAYPELVKLSEQMAHIPAVSRYMPIPFYYPTQPGNYLLRGLRARKGVALFDESIRDLIRKGCGSSDLTRFDEEFTFATWSKVGHMFATHDPEYVKNYFNEDQGCLVLIDPSYYNDQYRKGYARTEFESGINNVFYRGIPKNAIKLIYMSQSFKHDIEMLNGDRTIDDKFRSRLTSNAFKSSSIEELTQFRGHLHEEIEPLIGENGPISIHNRTHYRRFYDVIHFIDDNTAVAKSLGDRLKLDRVNGITRNDIEKETLRAAIAREVVAEEVGRDTFMSQDEMLTQLTDEEFKKKLPEMFTLLHLDKLPFKTTHARHGRKESGAKVSAYDHTLEVIAGQFGGFGLQTDLGFDPQRSRRILRLAALYHYVGLLPKEGEGKGNLVERSSKIAKEEMQRHMKLQGISHIDAHLISMLILHHEHFGDFLRGKISYEELQKRITEAYQQLPKDSDVSQANFTKMLWALFTARASTLRKVQESRQNYQTFLDLPKLDCSNLDWVRVLRERISGAPTPAIQTQAMQIAPLWDCDDETFKQQVAKLVGQKAFPYDFSALAASKAGHGHKADGTEVNLLEHTLDVICGNFGGFGLNTHLTIAGMSTFRIRKILRIAALFHDSGKIHGRAGHIEGSAEIAVQSLSKAKEIWNVNDEEIQLIKQLIINNDLFGQFLKGRSEIDHRQLLAAISKAYASQPLPVSEVDFRKLMFALWIADASTLKVVNHERGHLYRPLHRDLDTLDYDVLGRVYTLKYDIIEGQEDLPHMTEVSPGIYRGGQPNAEGLLKLDELGIKTLICFRREENLLPVARQMDLDVFHIPIDGNKTADYEAKVLDFLKMAKNASKPLFIFCEHGADRTGFMSAVYRYVIEGATLNEAIHELTQFKSHQSRKLQPDLIARLKGLDVNKLRRELGLSEILSVL